MVFCRDVLHFSFYEHPKWPHWPHVKRTVAVIIYNLNRNNRRWMYERTVMTTLMRSSAQRMSVGNCLLYLLEHSDDESQSLDHSWSLVTAVECLHFVRSKESFIVNPLSYMHS